MIGYITIGSNDLDTSGAFYDSLLSNFGYERAYTFENMIAYGFRPARPMLDVTRPKDGGPATHGNGTMVALMAANKEQVDQAHSAALGLGASNAGEPSSYESQFYGGHFRDADRNKFGVFVMQ
ncbi:VOC family protein [Notoacmeibacter marinus]|uniref:VOC family protein n=1 Tax=Notoacmeibacter marinus TaxID=1876515 RepID=UPI0013B06C78|nr:VOC family protein [Notoacmeibacter marinus]